MTKGTIKTEEGTCCLPCIHDTMVNKITVVLKITNVVYSILHAILLVLPVLHNEEFTGSDPTGPRSGAMTGYACSRPPHKYRELETGLLT
jgi:hypothetical protein